MPQSLNFKFRFGAFCGALAYTAECQTCFSSCRLHRPNTPAIALLALGPEKTMRDARWLGIFALAFITMFTTKECSGQSESLLRIGKAINVFIRYGYLSISMKVISYNDTEQWIFKEPTKSVFQVRHLTCLRQNPRAERKRSSCTNQRQ